MSSFPFNPHVDRTKLKRSILSLAFMMLIPCSGFATNVERIAQPEWDPVTLVEQADRIRFPKEAFQVDINVTNFAPGKTPDKRIYQVLSKGNSNTIVRTLQPASEAGQMMLMREHELWVFLPSVSQPVRMPLSQKLTGQVANGDLARANFTGDYAPKALRTEKIRNTEYAVMELSAINHGVTYQRVIYWVELQSRRPYKAEFYTISGRLMKTCQFAEFKQMNGAIRPTKLIMRDGLRKDEHSEMVYSGMKGRKLADKIFTKDYLKKLQN